jgi:hypothetical protein
MFRGKNTGIHENEAGQGDVCDQESTIIKRAIELNRKFRCVNSVNWRKIRPCNDIVFFGPTMRLTC